MATWPKSQDSKSQDSKDDIMASINQVAYTFAVTATATASATVTGQGDKNSLSSLMRGVFRGF